MSRRDPRIDPWPGDVLRSAGAGSLHVVQHVDGDQVEGVELSPGGLPRWRLSLADWRECAVDDAVIATAGPEER